MRLGRYETESISLLEKARRLDHNRLCFGISSSRLGFLNNERSKLRDRKSSATGVKRALSVSWLSSKETNCFASSVLLKLNQS